AGIPEVGMRVPAHVGLLFVLHRQRRVGLQVPVVVGVAVIEADPQVEPMHVPAGGGDVLRVDVGNAGQPVVEYADFQAAIPLELEPFFSGRSGTGAPVMAAVNAEYGVDVIEDEPV